MHVPNEGGRLVQGHLFSVKVLIKHVVNWDPGLIIVSGGKEAAGRSSILPIPIPKYTDRKMEDSPNFQVNMTL